MSRGPPPCQRPDCTDPATAPEYNLCDGHREEADHPTATPGVSVDESPAPDPETAALTDGGVVEDDAKTTDQLYEDRNKAVLGFLGLLDRATPDEGPVRIGWHPPVDADDADADEWAVVWAEIPLGAPLDVDEPAAVEQLSWHVPRDDAAGLPCLPRRYVEWDGHSRGEKLGRLTRLLTHL